MLSRVKRGMISHNFLCSSGFLERPTYIQSALCLSKSAPQQNILQSWKSSLHPTCFFNLFTVLAVCIKTLGLVGTTLINQSKVYKYLPHKLLIVKLEAYGLDNDRLTVLMDDSTYIDNE